MIFAKKTFENHYEQFSHSFKTGTEKEWLANASKLTSQMAVGLLRDADRQAKHLEPEAVIAAAKQAGYTMEPETFDEHRVQKALLEVQAVYKFFEAQHLIEWRDEHNPARNSVFAKAARALSGRQELASHEGLDAVLDLCSRIKSHPMMQMGIEVYPPRQQTPSKPPVNDAEVLATDGRSP